jgi:hypothetical protein
MNTENTTTEYLTDIKFRNAVKKATKLNVFGKNEVGNRYGVNISRVGIYKQYDNETVFTVTYWGGYRVANENSMRDVMDKNVRLVQDMMIAGFECVDVEVMNTYTRNIEIVRAYRKAA